MNAWERCQAEDEYEDLVALALRRQHPSGKWLAEHRAKHMTNATLTEAIKRLRAWAETTSASG